MKRLLFLSKLVVLMVFVATFFSCSSNSEVDVASTVEVDVTDLYVPVLYHNSFGFDSVRVAHVVFLANEKGIDMNKISVVDVSSGDNYEWHKTGFCADKIRESVDIICKVERNEKGTPIGLIPYSIKVTSLEMIVRR